MARLNARWLNFAKRGQAWDHFWQDAIASGTSNSQTLAVTLDGVAVAVSQTEQHPQSLAATLDDVAAAVSQGAQHAQSLAVALDDIAVDASGFVTHSSALAVTLDDVTFATVPTPPELSFRLGDSDDEKRPKKKKRKSHREEVREAILRAMDPTRAIDPQTIAQAMRREVIPAVTRSHEVMDDEEEAILLML